jgi:hypothetical protein
MQELAASMAEAYLKILETFAFREKYLRRIYFQAASFIKEKNDPFFTFLCSVSSALFEYNNKNCCILG